MTVGMFSFSHIAGKRLHLGVCGSVAAYKSIEIMRLLQKAGVHVGVTLTDSAQRFVTATAFSSLSAERVFTHMFAKGEGDFGHLYPGREADAFVIAPASATTISRVAHGSAEEILSGQALSYGGKIVFAPAMNPKMWNNEATQHNIETLVERGHEIVPPDAGVVACGDLGEGKLADIKDIFAAAVKALCPQDLSGHRILITLGPTAEAWDEVRLWTNRSTGTMGACLAIAAYCRGAQVYAVCGPGTPWLPTAIKRVDVQTADEMLEASATPWPEMTAGIFTAAVADFKPVFSGTGKVKKSGKESGFSIDFASNPDVLARLAVNRSGGQRVVGFAAESEELQQQVRKKLLDKQADMIVGNLVGVKDSGFGTGLNSVFVADKDGKEQEWNALPKPEVSWRVLDWLLRL